ncbi:MAG: GNVR domain-containing protein [Bacteroidota bacterium]
MKGAGNILRFVRPFIKGLPIILVCLVAGAGLGYRYLYYAIPTYMTVGTLQINDKESGASAFLENFEAFSMTGLILTEVEVLKSKYLMLKTLRKLDVSTGYFRYQRGKARNLYSKNPFRVEAVIEDSSWYNKHLQFTVNEDLESIELFFLEGEETVYQYARIGDSVHLEGLSIRLLIEDAYGVELSPGHYGFTIYNDAKLLSLFANHNLKVVLLDKEISIVKLAYTHEVPELATDLVNTLAETYIEDFIDNKTESAGKVLTFINRQVDTVEQVLKEAETRLANYKANTQVVDMKLEADAKLKRITDLDVRKLNLSLQKTELENLLQYITGDTLDPNLTPNYESVQDAAFTDALKQLSDISSDRRDLLQKYTVEHPEVLKLDQEISRIRKILVRSVQNTLATVRAKALDIEHELGEADSDFRKLPEIEKRIVTLQRQKFTNEQVLSFLLEKKAEASIGAASNISFHKVLEYAPVPKMALSPQKSLIMGVATLVGGMFGMLIVFLIHYLRAGIADVKDVQDNFDLPVIGTVRKIPDDGAAVSQDFINLTTNLLLAKDAKTICVSACSSSQGKDILSFNLAKAFAAIGHRTLLVDLDLYEATLHHYMGASNEQGICRLVRERLEFEDFRLESSIDGLDFLPAGTLDEGIPTGIILNPYLAQLHEQFQARYDRIIYHLPPLQTVMDAIPIMRRSELNLLSVRAGRTRFPQLKKAENLLRSFEIVDTYIGFIISENQRQATYTLDSTALPSIGQGARRRLLKNTFKALLLHRDFDGSYRAFAKLGNGDRRAVIMHAIHKLIGRKPK